MNYIPESIALPARMMIARTTPSPDDVIALAQEILEFDNVQDGDSTLARVLNRWSDTVDQLLVKYDVPRGKYNDQSELNLIDLLLSIKEGIVIERFLLDNNFWAWQI